MLSLSESEPPGCWSLIAAYCLGSYLMAPLIVGDPASLSPVQQWLLAPVLVPFLLFTGFMLIWAYGGVVLALAIMGCAVLAWGGLTLAALGLIRSWTEGDWKWWPAALIATIYALAVSLRWIGL